MEMITEVTLWPEGMGPGDPEASNFEVRVKWRGVQNEKKSMGGYAVEQGVSQLTRAGTWIFTPQRFQYHLCRWSTLEEALEAARNVVNYVTVNGKTWAEWRPILEERNQELLKTLKEEK